MRIEAKLNWIKILNDEGKYAETPKERLIFDNGVELDCLLTNIEFISVSNDIKMWESYKILPKQETKLKKLGIPTYTTALYNSVYDGYITI